MTQSNSNSGVTNLGLGLSAGLGVLGSIGGAIIGGASNSRAARRQFEYQKRLQEQAARLNYEYSLRSAENMPSSTRKGLENANYNPMLAVQNGTGSSSQFTSAGSAGSFDNQAAISSAISNATDLANLRNQTMISESSSDAYYAQADKAKMEKAEIVQRLPFVRPKAKAEYIKTQMESAKLENDIHYQNEYINYLKSSLKLQRELGLMGFANAKDIANIGAAAQRYGSDKMYDIGLKGLPPKWASTVGGILGTGIGAGVGVYSAVKGANKSAPLRKYR